MNLDRYTQKAQEAILQSQQIAQDLDHQSIEPTHLLLALVQ
jgi:ATP-dependent Clp protease ATP-binding subunit ClpB